MSNRRDFLKNISLFTAGGLLAGKAGSVNAANAALGVVDEVHAGKEIGLQIYSLSQELYVATKEQQEKVKGNPFAAFMKVGDQIYDLMLKDTDPSKVYFEMDVYWTVMGQNDPVEYMQKHPDRIKVLHIKDRAVFGQSGMMNFEMIFKQMYANGIKDYFVELEQMPDGRTQFAGVKDCADYLIKAPFVK